MDTGDTRSYYAKAEAGIGFLLLGGQRIAQSSRFAERADAWSWAQTLVDTNEAAGRAVAKVEIWPSVLDPEVTD